VAAKTTEAAGRRRTVERLGGELARHGKDLGEGKGVAAEAPHHLAVLRGHLIAGKRRRTGETTAARGEDGGGERRLGFWSAGRWLRRLRRVARGGGTLNRGAEVPRRAGSRQRRRGGAGRARVRLGRGGGEGPDRWGPPTGAREREREGGGGVRAGLGRRASCGPVRERERAGEGKGGEARALGRAGWAGPSGEKRKERKGRAGLQRKENEGGRKKRREGQVGRAQRRKREGTQ
jgi:hypothetical protein